MAALGLGLAWAQAPANKPSASASAWTAQKYGPMRLIAGLPQLQGFTPVAGKLYAGLHIKLDDGWKTYWRLPGESGVPPSFDWGGSANLGEARVLFPAPSRLPEAGMISLGYKGEVVFPIEITPREAGKPVDLALVAEYGVCRDICIPAEGRASLSMPAANVPGEGALIGPHLARVPRPAAAGTPILQSFKSELSGAAPRIVIEALFPQGSEGADALIEIAGGELAPLPVITGRTGKDVVRFEVRFASADEAKRFAGKAVLVTLLSATGQAEVPAQVQ